MPTLSQRLEVLAAGPAQETAAILLLALPRLAADERAAACILLASTGVPAATVGAVSNTLTLDDEAKRSIAHRLVLHEPCIRAVVAAGGEATLALVRLLALRPKADAALLLARLVATAPWDDARLAASEAMLAAIDKLLGPAANAAGLPHQLAKRLDGAMADAVDRYPEHRCDAVLHALALLARSPGPRLSAILADAGHAAMFALRHAVGRAERPELRRQLLRMLATPALAAVIQRNLHRAVAAGSPDDVLACAHLLRTPARKRALRGVDRPMRCVPSMPDAVAMCEEGQANLPLLIEALGLPTSKRIEHFADLVALSSTLGRLRAAIALSRYEANDVRTALKPLALDRSPAVARVAGLAALAGVPRSGEVSGVAATLVASRCAATARRARWQMSRASTDAFFTHWMCLSHLEVVAAAMQLMAKEPDALIHRLAQRLGDGSREERMSAIMLANRLRLLGFLEQEIIVLAGSTDPHVASAAVKGLGQHYSMRSSEAVRVALRHIDARVRANAVEALARHDAAGALETIAALAENRHNRLRANSVLALLRRNQPSGARALCSMLADNDPLHRVSGIWVAGRAHALFARKDVAALAERDGAGEIRRRAALALRRIDLATRPMAACEGVHA